MLGLVLVTHAPLGDSIAQCVQHVMGSVPDGFEVVDVPASEDIDTTVKRIQDAARAWLQYGGASRPADPIQRRTI